MTINKPSGDVFRRNLFSTFLYDNYDNNIPNIILL